MEAHLPLVCNDTGIQAPVCGVQRRDHADDDHNGDLSGADDVCEQGADRSVLRRHGNAHVEEHEGADPELHKPAKPLQPATKKSAQGVVAESCPTHAMRNDAR